MRITLITIIFSISILWTYAQDKVYIDSLVHQLDGTTSDTAKVNLLNKIAADILYVNSERIYDFANQALELSEKINYPNGIANAYNNLGIYYRTKGIYDMSIDYFFNSLNKFVK